MTKRTAVAKLERAGLVANKTRPNGYSIVEGTATTPQIHELFGSPRGRYKDHRGQEYTMWRDDTGWRLSLFDSGEFVLV